MLAAEERLRSQWDQTSLIVWAIAEAHRDRSKRRSPFTPSQFHPMAQREPEANKIKLTPSLFRARARAWYQRQGLPIPESIKED